MYGRQTWSKAHKSQQKCKGKLPVRISQHGCMARETFLFWLCAADSSFSDQLGNCLSPMDLLFDSFLTDPDSLFNTLDCHRKKYIIKNSWLTVELWVWGAGMWEQGAPIHTAHPRHAKVPTCVVPSSKAEGIPLNMRRQARKDPPKFSHSFCVCYLGRKKRFEEACERHSSHTQNKFRTQEGSCKNGVILF